MLSRAEKKFLKTGMTIEDDSPSRQRLSALQKSIRAKSYQGVEDLMTLFKSNHVPEELKEALQRRLGLALQDGQQEVTSPGPRKENREYLSADEDFVVEMEGEESVE